MTILEFFAAVTVAVFAMIGGAILNAAITSPERCAHALRWLDKWMRPFFSSAAALVAVALMRRYFWGSTDNLASEPLVWLAAGQIALIALLALAWKFVEVAQGAEQAESDHERDNVGK